MPVITATDKTTIEIGGSVKTDIKRLVQLSSGDRRRSPASLASRRGSWQLPERASNNSPPNAAQLAHDIRTAVIHYRFLQGEWGRYHPPAAKQKIKADALAALQTGDIGKAWELYDGLQKPAAPPPPTGLRIVAQ